MAELTNCPQCGAPIAAGARECKYCGEVFAAQAQAAPPPPQYQQPPYQAAPQYQQPFYPPQPQFQQPPVQQGRLVPKKSKIAAGLLALFLGGLGVHKFYLGKVGVGVVYLLFCWTCIPAFIALIEGIIYLTSSDEAFAAKYGGYYV